MYKKETTILFLTIAQTRQRSDVVWFSNLGTIRRNISTNVFRHFRVACVSFDLHFDDNIIRPLNSHYRKVRSIVYRRL